MSTIAYLGPEASYTHQAALKINQKQGSKNQLQPQVTIEDVFAAVESGSAESGVVPLENSSNGSVVFTFDLLADVQAKYSSIIVVDEVYLPVRHCLVGGKSTSSNGVNRGIKATVTGQQTVDLSRIKKLYSHPQAWGQCKAFLGSKLKGVERQDVSSTSKGAEIVSKENESLHSAAISSKLAAEIYGIDVLAEGIEDFEGNSTRFFVIQRQSSAQVHDAKPDQETGIETHKTMVSFTVDHNIPGALADALAVFGKHGLSLTSINTRPSGQQNWMYIFFIEFWGRKDQDRSNSEVNLALAEVQRFTKSFRWLGSWKCALQNNA